MCRIIPQVVAGSRLWNLKSHRTVEDGSFQSSAGTTTVATGTIFHKFEVGLRPIVTSRPDLLQQGQGFLRRTKCLVRP
ncbi:hypothetical protein CPLU01_13506 [Colletotrichum plurivorum]|uniref:Uncharacterized protein n=1 Tax=Colletotrichum plurivorum TaxID=2175906 RepID=A0A8H6JRV7_9PEZI|nr:hypothetical protein CPLU01_13506 [Colletotrichum plurivorum]